MFDYFNHYLFKCIFIWYMGLVNKKEQHKSILIFFPKQDEAKHTKTRFKWEVYIK